MGYNEEQLGAIADAIRTVTGQTDKIKATEFANIIKTFNGPTFEVKYNLQNLTSDGKSFGVMNKDYVATFTPAQYHEVPETVEIAIGGVTATQGAEYTYINGVITIFGNKITGDIEINANGKAVLFPTIYIRYDGTERAGYAYNDGVGQSLQIATTLNATLNNVWKLKVMSASSSSRSVKITQPGSTTIIYSETLPNGTYIDITEHLLNGCTVILK